MILYIAAYVIDVKTAVAKGLNTFEERGFGTTFANEGVN